MKRYLFMTSFPGGRGGGAAVADPETSERRGQKTSNISRRIRWPSIFGLFLLGRGGGMAPLAPPESATGGARCGQWDKYICILI